MCTLQTSSHREAVGGEGGRAMGRATGREGGRRMGSEGGRGVGSEGGEGGRSGREADGEGASPHFANLPLPRPPTQRRAHSRPSAPAALRRPDLGVEVTFGKGERAGGADDPPSASAEETLLARAEPQRGKARAGSLPCARARKLSEDRSWSPNLPARG